MSLAMLVLPRQHQPAPGVRLSHVHQLFQGRG